MDILPTEEEDMVRNLAREFLEGECPTTLVRAMEKDDQGYPPELWKKMVELGWPGISLPEQYGGQGLPLTYLGIILEEVGRAMAPVPLHSTMVAALTVAEDGSDAQKQAVLPGVSSGDLLMTWAFQEVDARLQPDAVQLTATADGDNFVLNGNKRFVDNFNVADHVVVVARTAEASSSNKGLSVFVVDAHDSGLSYTPYVTLAKDKQGEVDFNNVRVPAANLIGELNQGWPIAEAMLDRGTALLCCQMLGSTRKDAELAIEYAKNRVAFGRPIGAFQSVAHMLADMIMYVDGGELLTHEALWRMDQGLPATIEVSQAKAFCNERCQATVRNSQSIHGGIGFMMEFDLHLWYRRVSASTMRLGTSYEHRRRISQALLDNPGIVQLGESMYDLAPVA
jgi:alkylation response protein AidB-like acyl-CoA dehydrogenase